MLASTGAHRVRTEYHRGAWAREAQVQRADLELAGATAAVLDVSLADLFDVNAIPDLPEEESVLDEADTLRLSELLDLQQARELSDNEATELTALDAKNNRLPIERSLKARAERQGVSVEQARHELEAALAEAERVWQELNADPERLKAAVAKLRRRGCATTAPA